MKVSDFGLSALPKQVCFATLSVLLFNFIFPVPYFIKKLTPLITVQGVDVLHTTCGTPNYAAPEVDFKLQACISDFS